ncbi:MAG: hypothetical protein HYZ74_02690 [Elusimicrobia bacterium]|nr:hypothetical protein [Elusimicrobiota bacterium]
MNPLKIICASVLVVSAAVAAQAATPKPVKLNSVTGSVQIKTASGVMTVKAGEPIPEIPAGAEITVLTGDAVVESGGVTVKANAGDSFTVGAGKDGAISINVTNGVVLVVGADGAVKDVAKGETVSVAAKSDAPAPAPAPAPKEEKKEEAAEPESIPAEQGETGDTQAPAPPPSSSPQQENTVVSPSTP